MIKKKEINKVNKEITLKNINFNQILLNNTYNKNNLINNYIKPYNEINNTILLNPYKDLLNKTFIDKKQYLLAGSINNFNEQKNNNICKKIKSENKSENLNNIGKIDNNNLNQIKSNKCNFILIKIDNKQKISNEDLLGRKRSLTATFKTIILNKENDNIKQKIINKSKNNSNIKILSL